MGYLVSRQAHGLRAWLLQRITAVYLLLFLLYLSVHFLRSPLDGFGAWHAWLAHPLVNLATGLFVLSLLLHAWVGIRDIVIDYVTHTGLRVSLFAAVMLLLGGCGIWSLRVLFMVAVQGSGS